MKGHDAARGFVGHGFKKRIGVVGQELPVAVHIPGFNKTAVAVKDIDPVIGPLPDVSSRHNFNMRKLPVHPFVQGAALNEINAPAGFIENFEVVARVHSDGTEGGMIGVAPAVSHGCCHQRTAVVVPPE